MKQSNKASLLMSFLTCFLFSCCPKSTYANYYVDNIFYIRVNDIAKQTYNVSALFDIECYFNSLYPKDEVMKVATRFLDQTGKRSYLYGVTIPKDYHSVKFRIKDSDGVYYLDSYLTNIQNFRIYTLSYNSSYQYSYSDCYWSDSSLTVSEFSNLFLLKYDLQSNSVYFGKNSYPNLLESFFEHLVDAENLETYSIYYNGISTTALQLWESIEDNFCG